MERQKRQRVEDIVVGKIESGIPLLSVKSRRKSKYPFVKMKVGDSFMVKGLSKKSYNTIYVAAKRANVRVTLRSVDGGYRVWRVKEKKS